MLEYVENDPQITQLNEMMLNVQDSLPENIENSIYYPKLKTLLHSEIINFCKEQIELKADLNMFRMNVGQPLTEKEIREYLDGLMEKYNQKNSNICLTYHIEITRVDFGVPVFVVLRRGNTISVKKFVFRFRKVNQSSGLGDLSNSGILTNNPLDTLKGGN